MTDRCWEELRRAGKALAEDRGDLCKIVNAVATYFEIPKSPAAEAVGVFLEGLRGALEDEAELEQLAREWPVEAAQ
jgi:hypothetical protein